MKLVNRKLFISRLIYQTLYTNENKCTFVNLLNVQLNARCTLNNLKSCCPFTIKFKFDNKSIESSITSELIIF
jgi:hypothetical protein